MKFKLLTLVAVAFVMLLGVASTSNAGDGKFVLGGYFDVNYIYYQQAGKPSSFDMFHFNPIFLYQVEDNVLVSAELEFEHGGDEIVVEYAQLDYLWNDYLTVTAGKFLVPFGAFNRRLHPGWISKVPGKPYSNNHVVPTGWSETGVMLSGAVGFGVDGGRVNYASYVVNGLEGEAGADMRDLRKEMDPREKNNKNKGVGGRLGIVPVSGIEFGGSFYTGKYDAVTHPVLTLNMFGVDAEFHHEDYLEIRGEYNEAKQDTTENNDISKKGYYVQGALKLSVTDNDLLMPVELAVRYSKQDFPGEASDKWELTPTLNYYIGTSTIFRLAYTINGESGTDVDNNTFTAVFTKGL